MNERTSIESKNVTARTVLLVNPSVDSPAYTREDRLRTYLSLGALASVLRSEPFMKRIVEKTGLLNLPYTRESSHLAFDVRALSLSLQGEGQTIGDYLAEFIESRNMDPIMLCATATSGDLDQVMELAEAAKTVAPHALRVIGGPHVSVEPEEFLRTSLFQVACMGEGAETLAELALSTALSPERDFSPIQGIAYKDKQGQVRVNQRRQYAFNLDDYPCPSDALDLFVDDLADRGKNARDLVYVLAGMGCPFDCSFCAQKAINQGRVRERSAESLFAEIEGLYHQGFRKFALVQESFFSNRKRFRRFCDLIEKSGLRVEWTAEARADQVDLETLQTAQSHGLRFIQIGLESGDQDVLNSVSKKIRVNDVEKVFAWLRELKIDTAVYLLVGLPAQGWQSVLRTALFIKNNPPCNRVTKHLSVAIAVPYPGARLASSPSIRLLPGQNRIHSWPARNPVVDIAEDGSLRGENFTETDAMTAQEILEAFFLLDNFGYFLLHALYDASLNQDDRRYSYDLALSMFHAIERRALRDLIVRAHDGPAPRNRLFNQLLEHDGHAERLIKDISEGSSPALLTEFLASTHFKNGYPVLKELSVDRRIMFMKLCARVWTVSKRLYPAFIFDQDSPETAALLDKALQTVNPDEPEEPPGAADTIDVAGMTFHVDRDRRAIVVDVS